CRGSPSRSCEPSAPCSSPGPRPVDGASCDSPLAEKAERPSGPARFRPLASWVSPVSCEPWRSPGWFLSPRRFYGTPLLPSTKYTVMGLSQSIEKFPVLPLTELTQLLGCIQHRTSNPWSPCRDTRS